MSDMEYKKPEEGRKNQPLEDRAMKEAAWFFGEELLPLLGIRGKVRRIAPTEQVYLHLKDYLQDFNYEMMDGTWTHLEFESDRIRKEDLRRYRAYEAVMSHHYQVEVRTCVICSSDVKEPESKLTEGVNTYRVKIIRLKDQDAGQIIRRLERRQKKKRLRRSELLQLLLTPLMGGEMPQKERMTKAFMLLKRERGNRRQDEQNCMEVVLYALAVKFLPEQELEKLKEAVNMTVLGEMIRQDGIEIGLREGRQEGEARINRLNGALIDMGRIEDLKRASKDRDFQEKLMKELFPEENTEH